MVLRHIRIIYLSTSSMKVCTSAFTCTALCASLSSVIMNVISYMMVCIRHSSAATPPDTHDIARISRARDNFPAWHFLQTRGATGCYVPHTFDRRARHTQSIDPALFRHMNLLSTINDCRLPSYRLRDLLMPNDNGLTATAQAAK